LKTIEHKHFTSLEFRPTFTWFYHTFFSLYLERLCLFFLNTETVKHSQPPTSNMWHEYWADFKHITREKFLMKAVGEKHS